MPSPTMIRLCVCSPTTVTFTFPGVNAKAELGQYREAIFDFDQTLRLKPYFVGAYINRGNAKVELGQYREAIVDYDQAIRLQP